MKYVGYLWFIPMLVLIVIYGGEALGVFLGETEHYEILAGFGLGNGLTMLLVWLSVVIEVAIIGALFWKPSALTFSLAALWPWVPRLITVFTGLEMEMMEMDMSLLATMAAMAAYIAYENDIYPSSLRKRLLEA